MKLKKRFLAEIKFTAFHYPVVSIALLTAALASLWFAGIGARDFAKATRTAAVLKQDGQGLIKLQKRPVSAAEIEALVSVLRQNHQGIEIAHSGSPGGLTITAATPEGYREWISALGTIQGAGRAGSVWLATELCVASCGAVSLRAEVQGLTQSVGKGV